MNTHNDFPSTGLFQVDIIHNLIFYESIAFYSKGRFIRNRQPIYLSIDTHTHNCRLQTLYDCNNSQVESGKHCNSILRGGGGMEPSRNQCANGTQNPNFVAVSRYFSSYLFDLGKIDLTRIIQARFHNKIRILSANICTQIKSWLH